MKKNSLCVPSGLAIALVLLAWAPKARANVYATNIKINGSQVNAVSAVRGSPVTISYLLNESATAGVKVEILSGTNVLRTLAIASGSGTAKGTNAVAWDGQTDAGTPAAAGTYSVRVTAAATGYTNWTQISDDLAPTSYCSRPRGIAVNKNPHSPYYGRIFIGNSLVGPGAATNAWGDLAGFYKLNADGSLSEDGAGSFGTANYPFSGGAYYDGGDNPLNMKVKEDDRLYWNNWVGKGEVVACDMLLTTNQVVMPEGFYTGNPFYPGDNWKTFEVTDVTTDHARVYLCDANYPSGGAWYWPMTNGAVNVNDPSATVGYQALQALAGGDVSLRCDGIAIDAQTNVYVLQTRGNAGDANNRVVCFTNWDGVTPLFTGAAWAVGAKDDTFRNQYNLALDSVTNPKYLAVGMSSLTSGGIRVLSVTNGASVMTNLSVTATYHGVAWDNVGNLYGGSQSDRRWRAFSPPGANQATTPALATINLLAPPVITGLSANAGTVTIRFTYEGSETASAFTVQGATAVTGPYLDLGSATVSQVSPGVFQATLPGNDPSGFYRIKK